jgi:ABC-type dipeptide transport system, periplasmic component
MNTIGDQDFRPVLAKSWTWSPDSLSIAFHLNPEARWHDGKKVTADDVAFTYTIYNDSLLGSSNREQLTNVASVTAPIH